MIAREPTFDLAIGLGGLRWEDDPTAVRAIYPDATDVPRREVRLPGSGRRQVIGAGLRIEDLLRTESGVFVVGTVRFSDAGRLYELTLDPDPTKIVIEACNQFDRWFLAMIDAVEELGRRFELDPAIDRDEEEQSWTTDAGIEVALLLEEDRWEMKLVPNGPVMVEDA